MTNDKKRSSEELRRLIHQDSISAGNVEGLFKKSKDPAPAPKDSKSSSSREESSGEDKKTS